MGDRAPNGARRFDEGPVRRRTAGPPRRASTRANPAPAVRSARD